MAIAESVKEAMEHKGCPVCGEPIYINYPMARGDYRGCCSKECARAWTLARAVMLGNNHYTLEDKIRLLLSSE